MKVRYTNLGLKVNKDVNTFDFNGIEIEVLKYLPIEQKNDLILITAQQAEEDGVYNPNKIEMHFNLNLVYLYSNLTFTEKQKEDEAKIYDTLKCSGFFDKFYEAMEDEEYNYIYNTFKDYTDTVLNYKTTAASVIQSLIVDMPKNAKAAAEIVNSFDKEKFEEVVKFAKSTNAGNSIS